MNNVSSIELAGFFFLSYSIFHLSSTIWAPSNMHLSLCMAEKVGACLLCIRVIQLDLYSLFLFLCSPSLWAIIRDLPFNWSNICSWEKIHTYTVKTQESWGSKREQWRWQKISIIWTSSKMQVGSASHPASSLWLSFSIRSATSLWLHLLKATSLFSVYISTAAMAQDMDATGAWRLSWLRGKEWK